MSRAYSVYETKTKLSEILRLVKSGKEVIVNERGHPIAKILPFEVISDLETRWTQLVSSGQIQEAASAEPFEIHQAKKGALERFLHDRE